MEGNIQDDDAAMAPGTVRCFFVITVQFVDRFTGETLQAGARLELTLPDDVVGLKQYEAVIDHWNAERFKEELMMVPQDHNTLYWYAEPLRYATVRTPMGGRS